MKILSNDEFRKLDYAKQAQYIMEGMQLLHDFFKKTGFSPFQSYCLITAMKMWMEEIDPNFKKIIAIKVEGDVNEPETQKFLKSFKPSERPDGN